MQSATRLAAGRVGAISGLIAAALLMVAIPHGDAVAEPVLIIEYQDQCPRVGKLGAGRTAEVGGVTVSLEPLFVGACNYLKEQMTASIQARVDSIQGQFQAAVRKPVDDLYRDFKIWLAEQVYAGLPEDIRAKYAFGTDKWNDYYNQWLDNPDQELSLYVNTYLKERFPRVKALLDKYQTDNSMEIIDGLKTLYSEAKTKLQKLTAARQEIEANPTTEYADILKKHGISGPWLDRFQSYEARFNVFNDRYNLVEAGKTLYGALQAERGRDKIAGAFTLLSQIGDVAYRSDIPGVSLFGQIIKAYGDVAQELLKQVNALEQKIRQREGFCIGLATHTMEDERNQAFIKHFGDDRLVCPVDQKRPLLKDIYQEVEGDTPNRLYFWDGKKFIAGNIDGGGMPAVRRAQRLIEAAADAGPRYAKLKGKGLDPATVAGVYNTTYDHPEYGRGLSGLLREAAAVFDGIEEQLRRLNGGLETVGPHACSSDALRAFLKDDVGFRTEVGGLDEEGRTRDLSIADQTHRLKPSYAMGYIAKQGKVPGLGSGGGAYDTYSKIWKKLEPLSMLVLRGRVRAKGREGQVCKECAGADLTISISNGRQLPKCEVKQADERGDFALHIMTRSQDVSARLSARAEGKASEPIEAGRAAMGTPAPAFAHSFDVTLRIPFEEDEEEVSDTEDEPDEPEVAGDLSEAAAIVAALEGLASAAEGRAGAIEQACASARDAAATATAQAAEIDAKRAELDAAIAGWNERARTVGDAGKRAAGFARTAEGAAKNVASARKSAEKSALAACQKMETLRAAKSDAMRQQLLEAVRSALDAARGHSRTGAENLTGTSKAAADARAVEDSLPGLEPDPKSMADEASTLRQRARDLAKTAKTSADTAAKSAKKAAKDLADMPRKADGLLADGQAALQEAPQTDAARALEERLLAAHARVQAATKDADACVPEAVKAAKEAASTAESVAKGLAATIKEAEKAGGSKAGQQASAVIEHAAAAQASADVAEVFQEATEKVVGDAQQCLQLAEDAVRQVDEDRGNALAEARDACRVDKPGSVAVWDDKKNRAVCRCPENRVETEDGAACVDPSRFTQWAAQQCAEKYPNSTAEKSDPRKGSYRCTCPSGFEWTGDKAACVNVSQFVARVREMCAENYPNSVLVDYDIKDDTYSCNCPDGFTWNNQQTECLNVGDFYRRAAAICLETDPQAVVQNADPANDTFDCVCRQGFVWNGRSCVDTNRVIAAAQQACARDWPGSQLVQVVQVEPLRYRCNCPAGTVWNRSRTACIGAPRVSPQDAQRTIQAIQSIMQGLGGSYGGRTPTNCHRNPTTGELHCGTN